MAGLIRATGHSTQLLGMVSEKLSLQTPVQPTLSEVSHNLDRNRLEFLLYRSSSHCMSKNMGLIVMKKVLLVQRSADLELNGTWR